MKFEKGSKEMKEFMAKIRSNRGKKTTPETETSAIAGAAITVARAAAIIVFFIVISLKVKKWLVNYSTQYPESVRTIIPIKNHNATVFFKKIQCCIFYTLKSGKKETIRCFGSISRSLVLAALTIDNNKNSINLSNKRGILLWVSW